MMSSTNTTSQFSRIEIKPLSVNQAWQGKRFKTKLYLKYENDILLMLPKIEMPEPLYFITYIVWYSNSASDIDNFLKPFQDILCKKYKFNDNKIAKLLIQKFIVPKGKEHIDFKIEHFE